MRQLYRCVQDLEDRYYDTTMAWEKELRDLINQSKIKSERIQLLESQVHGSQQSRNDLKHIIEGYQKDIQFIGNSLQVYGYINPDHESQLTLESIKRVFEENERLKGDLEKLLDNIESSRQDLHKISATNKSAVQGIPTLLSQQYKVAKDVYDQQTEQIQKQFNAKLAENTNEMQRARGRLIEIIDEKSKIESESTKLKQEKRELKSQFDQ